MADVALPLPLLLGPFSCRIMGALCLNVSVAGRATGQHEMGGGMDDGMGHDMVGDMDGEVVLRVMRNADFKRAYSLNTSDVQKHAGLELAMAAAAAAAPRVRADCRGLLVGGSSAVRNPQKELMSARWPRAGAASLARWIGQLRGGEPSHEESRSMPPSQRDQARSRRASGWSQLLITANGLEKPPVAGSAGAAQTLLLCMIRWNFGMAGCLGHAEIPSDHARK